MSNNNCVINLNCTITLKCFVKIRASFYMHHCIGDTLLVTLQYNFTRHEDYEIKRAKRDKPTLLSTFLA